jgi:hypothetical protein
MDYLSALSPVEMVALCFASQLGKTELGLNWSFYNVDTRPGPMMQLMPTVEMVEATSTQRIEPAIAAMPDLAARFTTKGTDKRNTIRRKSFPGGTWYFFGANSANGLSSFPIQYLDLDEVDRFPIEIKDEGNPVNLAIARTRNFRSKRKILLASTLCSKRPASSGSFCSPATTGSTGCPVRSRRTTAPSTGSSSIYPYVLVRLRCGVCKRSGAHKLARLAARFGSEALLDDVVARLSADCPWQDDPRGGCGARLSDLPPSTPPDLPPAMRWLRVVGGRSD